MSRSPGLIAIACIVVLAAVAAAPAQARTNTLEGSFRGDPDASIELAVKLTRKGEPKQVTRIRYERVDANCPDGSVIAISGKTRGHKVKRQPRGQRTFSGGGWHSDPLVNVFGRINGRGTIARGQLAFVGDPSTTCLNGPGPSLAQIRFRAEK